MRRRHAVAGLLLLAAGCAAPPHPESQTPFEAGKEAAAQSSYGSAIPQFTLAIDNARDYVFTAAHLERGDAYLAIAQQEEGADRDEHLKSALADFTVVVNEQDISPEERARAYLRRGRAFLEKGEVRQAEENFAHLLLLPPAQDLPYRLEAHRELGWILLNRARVSPSRDASAVEEVLSEDRYRKAQEEFSSGLEIDPDDEKCNLGKGMCLHFRKLNREAILYLERCVTLSEAKGMPEHEGHYYLGRAVEATQNFQANAAEQYRKAVEQDSEQSFTPLYAHLVGVLPVYVPFEDPQFQWFLDKMLAFAGGDATYWSLVESFATGLVNSDSPDRQRAGLYARAIARARSGKIEDAVKDSLGLARNEDFLDRLSRIFPSRQRHPEYLYGRALALLEAGRNEQLEKFFEEPPFTSLDPSLLSNNDYQKTLVLRGRNIVARWLTSKPIEGDEGQTQNKLNRDRILGRARDLFQSYLDDPKHRGDHDVRMDLGDVLEKMEAYPAAFLSYALIAPERPTDADLYRRIQRLHESRLLPEKDLVEAWKTLGDYGGTDSKILEYKRKTLLAKQSEATLYCLGCGRKGAEGDTMCLECGRQIGRTSTAEPGPTAK